MKPKLSQTSKMPCKSFALPRSTCPMKCSYCYAHKGYYLFKAVQELREHNLKCTRQKSFVADMVSLIDGMDYFRWHDSGDIYSKAYLKKIEYIARCTPKTKHWIPTKAWIKYYDELLAFQERCPNVTIRCSSAMVDYINAPMGFPCSMVAKDKLPMKGRYGTFTMSNV